MLYIFDGLNTLNEAFYEKTMPLLSGQRKEKIKKLRFSAGKNASSMVYLLLRLGLIEEYDINEPVEFIFESKGKPVLKKYPHIRFNFSHSSGTAACAISKNNIGVDVQQIKTIKDNVAKRVLSAEEYIDFKNTDVPNEYFCEIWTIKESYLKLTGNGISDILTEITAASIEEKMVYKGKDYFCCVCGRDAQTLPVKYIGREDIEQLYHR